MAVAPTPRGHLADQLRMGPDERHGGPRGLFLEGQADEDVGALIESEGAHIGDREGHR
jgi:hypothetical protein